MIDWYSFSIGMMLRIVLFSLVVTLAAAFFGNVAKISSGTKWQLVSRRSLPSEMTSRMSRMVVSATHSSVGYAGACSNPACKCANCQCSPCLCSESQSCPCCSTSLTTTVRMRSSPFKRGRKACACSAFTRCALHA